MIDYIIWYLITGLTITFLYMIEAADNGSVKGPSGSFAVFLLIGYPLVIVVLIIKGFYEFMEGE